MFFKIINGEYNENSNLLVAGVFAALSDTKQDIEIANKKGNVVFLVVTEKGNSQKDQAMKLANQAQKLYSKSTVLELDRSNSANSTLILNCLISNTALTEKIGNWQK